MSLNKFENIFRSLDHVYQQVVLDIIKHMKHNCNPASLNDLIHEKIEKRMQELNMSKKDLFKKVTEIINPYKKTEHDFYTYFSRKSIDGELLPQILFALNITADYDGGTDTDNGFIFSKQEVDIELEKLSKALNEIKKEYSEAQQTDCDGNYSDNIFWLYETLCKPDKLMIEYIAEVLYTLQTNPDEYTKRYPYSNYGDTSIFKIIKNAQKTCTE